MDNISYQNAFYAALRNRFKTLFNRYKVNTLADGGTVRDDSFTKAYMKMAQDNRMSDSIKFAWLGEAGIKQSGGRVSKLYGLPDKLSINENATQSTAANQPYLSGNIAPNERYALKNPNGGSNYMTHPTISFGATDAWSVTTVLNWNCLDSAYSEIWSDGTDGNKLVLSEGTGFNVRFKNNSNTLNITPVGFMKSFIGKTVCLTICASNNQILIYANSILINTVGGNTNTIISKLFQAGITNRTHTGSIHAHIIRSQALTQQQVTAEYNLLRSYIPEIENVTIGTQQWATSNFEAVCTPQGNLIQEMQANGNVEKITNIADREFSSDTGFWSKGTGWTIADGIATHTGTVMSNLTKEPFFSTGKFYKITLTVTGGSVGIYCGSASYISVTGTSTVYLINAGNTGFFLQTNTNGVTIDNISVQEIGWSGSQELYDGIYAQTAGTVEQKTYAAVKAASMWYHYNNDVAIGAVYGKLYNWFAVKLLQMDIDYYNAANPTALWGWRVPTQTDFQTLSTYLGGDAVSGGKMKVASTPYWNAPNTGAENSSGLSLLGSGFRQVDGSPASFKGESFIVTMETGALYLTANLISTSLFATFNKRYGFSLRLIKS